MILEEKVYLEHYGKKGMKWGKRNTKAGRYSTPKEPLTKREREIRNRKRGNRAATIVIGAIYVASLFAPPSKNTSVNRSSTKLPIKDTIKWKPEVPYTQMDKDRQRSGARELRNRLKLYGEDVI